jgi:N-terminal acetyltransferase B complex catalytic subunit
VLGKVEGDRDSLAKKSWHGHVTAVTVAPEARKQGLACILMNYLEKVTVWHNGWFVDLFVLPSNFIAVKMYKSMGY